MEDFYWDQLLPENDPDVELCIFPHLQEFIVIDRRETPPNVQLLHTEKVFDEEFNECVQFEISNFLTENKTFPFSHLMDMPNKIEEIIRGIAMTFVLETLDIDPDSYESVPSIVAYVISGGSVKKDSDHLLSYLKSECESFDRGHRGEDWAQVITSLRDQEQEQYDSSQMRRSHQAFDSDKLDYFSFWENRN
tara:strand:+ start:4492 stop:5067 length:576 start_codon:yes stop_codon:yes gene_type:complete